MRHFIYLLLFSNFIYSQEFKNSSIDFKIDSIKNQIYYNNNKIENLKNLNIRLNNNLDSLILEKQNKQFEIQNDNNYLCIIGTCLKSDIIDGNIVICIKKDDRVSLLEIKENYYYVDFNGKKGWIAKEMLRSEREIENELRLIQEENEFYKNLRKSAEETKKKEVNDRKVTLLKKYGNINGQKIIDEKIWINMTKEMLIDSWGKPEKVNRTVGEWGIHEQWIYGKTYLYLENGILKSWQD
jgi:hypothetical protein